MQYRMDHIVLNVDDDEKMIAFYTDILMMPAERLEEYRAGRVAFASVRLNRDTIIDLFPKKLWQESGKSAGEIGNLNHFCVVLEKSDWEALADRLKSFNIDIEAGPAPRWGAHGTGTSMYFRDPEHNLIEARYYEKNNAPNLINLDLRQ